MGLAMDISNVQVSDFGEVVGLLTNLVMTLVQVKYVQTNYQIEVYKVVK